MFSTRQWRIATVSKVPVAVHWTFLLLPLYLVINHHFIHQESWSAVGLLLLEVLSLFGCVVLHEFGHVFAARHYGIDTRDVVIYPIGGVATLLGIPEKPWQEIAVAVAGPLVNVVIALLLGVGFWLAGLPLLPEDGDGVSFGVFVLFSNIVLVVFNLVPAFPMDGGRVFRALLSLRLDRVRATLWAMYVARVLSVGFVVLGVYFGSSLWIIGILVWFGSMREYRMAQQLEAMRKEEEAAAAYRYVYTPHDNDLKYS